MFHVATPVDFQDKEPEEVVTKRSIDGALGILKACLNSKTVKRVVYTSSASAVQLGKEEDVEQLDESSWSDIDYIKAVKPYGGSYMISKTLTERAVLEFSEKYGLDVVTVIPSFVVGPFICPKLPGSVQTTLSMAFGMYSLKNVFESQVQTYCKASSLNHVLMQVTLINLALSSIHLWCMWMMLPEHTFSFLNIMRQKGDTIVLQMS